MLPLGQRDTHVTSNGIENATVTAASETTRVSVEKEIVSSVKGAPPSVEATARNSGLGGMGRPPQRAIIQPSLVGPTKPVTERPSLQPIPRTVRAQPQKAQGEKSAKVGVLKTKVACGTPTGQAAESGKKTTATCTPNSTEPNATTAVTSSFLDDVPLETCLEYLTRPHRSWDSAIRIRELYRQRTEEHRRAVLSRTASVTEDRSARLSPASSASNFSIRSAPTTVGQTELKPLRTGRLESRGGVLRQGRFGAPPGTKPEPEGLSVGGLALPASAVRPASRLFPLSSKSNDQSHLAGAVSTQRLPAEAAGKSTTPSRVLHDFSFSMR
ncbi:hypothetical protein ERJ75_001235900 [Trypanosoma vivax]|uniref:Uncharacterized protein n=1 Tax=Trypanosoma vivax (strain Y486) TaxID=1055687 RepID=G0U0Q6_TRYVY|nr:hypothetical protein TRVL_00018 [Trypanosoma vivax]KAH8608793.1 hypothetical protein ERJ75_001235900 [Trypanosoma vivax]CCC49655.1 conserved hypothetical protein [Trypanosoma vivax Y486]